MAVPTSSSFSMSHLVLSIPRFVFMEDNGKQFVAYDIELSDGLHSWKVTHRYSTLYDMHNKISAKYKGEFIPDFPPKKYFGTTDPVFLNLRRRQLEAYLHALLRIPAIRESEELSAVLMLQQQFSDNGDGWSTGPASNGYVNGENRRGTASLRGSNSTSTTFVDPEQAYLQQVPYVLRQCFIALEEKALFVDGIFRITPANTALVRDLKNELETDGAAEAGTLNLRSYDPHIVAAVLKLYIKEMPAPVISGVVRKKLIEADILDRNSRLVAMRRALLDGLPPTNFAILRGLFRLLYRISEHSHLNNMTATNLAICFSPLLFPQIPQVTDIITTLIEQHALLFAGV